MHDIELWSNSGNITNYQVIQLAKMNFAESMAVMGKSIV